MNGKVISKYCNQKNMKAEFVNEKIFKQHKDPLKSLGVGLLSMSDVKTGDIIKSKIAFSIKKLNRAIGPDYVMGDQFPGDTYFYIINATLQTKGNLAIHFEPAGSLKHAKEIRDGVPGVFKGPSYHTWGPMDQWEWYFEPLQRSQY